MVFLHRFVIGKRPHTYGGGGGGVDDDGGAYDVRGLVVGVPHYRYLEKKPE